ncbi:MAG TPA: hypothetical protein V6C84_18760 [Coleofasciculaceae cyanobacterium]|jgi:hypothetical protein
MNNFTTNLLLISFYSADTDALIAEQTAALLNQLDIKATAFNGRLVFVMSEASRAVGNELRDFAKNFCFPGKAADLPGWYKLIEGNSMKAFKQAYLRQHKESLGPIRSMYIADCEMLHSYLQSKIAKSSLNYDALYERMDALTPGENPF